MNRPSDGPGGTECGADRVEGRTLAERTRQAVDSLLAEWVALAGPDAERFGRDLIARYRDPHRHYHTVEHLAHMLHLFDALADEADDPRAVRYAAWFHDAVYDIDGDAPLSSEERSARLAENVLKAMHAPPALIAETSRLVRLTAAHRPEPGDANGRVLCDADLAILGAKPDDYLRYCAQIREEYRRYSDEQFRAGRAAVLRSLLDCRTIYWTELARERYEAAARRNMADELARLAVPA
jgi:predicted metal-dependent HD superfamily phosphohydrolase